MSALMSDVIEGKISPAVTTAACNAGGKLLKMLELEFKYSGRNVEKKPLKIANEREG